MKKFQIILIAWCALVAVFSWKLWDYGRNVAFNSVTGIDFEIPALIGFVLLTAVVVLGYILFQQKKWAWLISLLVGLTFLSYFGINKINIVAVAISVVLNYWSAARVRREVGERRVLNIPDAFYHGLFPVILGLFIMISFAAYQSPLAEEIKGADQLPNQSQIFFQQIVDKTIGQKINATDPAQRERLIKEISSQTFQEVNSFLRPYFQYAPPVLAFGLFLILWGLSFVFIWLGGAVGMLLYWILKMTRVVRVEEHDVKAEVLVI